MANFEKRIAKLEQTKSYLPIPVFLDIQDGETDEQAKVRISKQYPATQVIVWLSKDELTI